jgi:hypothetical protein
VCAVSASWEALRVDMQLREQVMGDLNSVMYPSDYSSAHGRTKVICSPR